MDLCWQSDALSMFFIAFLPRSKCLLISWLQSLSTVILEPKKIKSDAVSTFSPCICHEVMGWNATILVFGMLSFKPAFSLSPLTLIKEGTDKILCAPGPRGQEQWPHKRVSRTCLWMFEDLWQRRGLALACCGGGGTANNSLGRCTLALSPFWRSPVARWEIPQTPGPSHIRPNN